MRAADRTRVETAEFLLEALGCAREGLEYLQSLADVTDGLEIGRMLNGPPACPLPIVEGRHAQASLRIVMSQQFGLSLADVGEVGLQHLGNMLMVLLAGAAEQRLIGGILHQGMLKEVGRLGWPPSLIEQFSLDQLRQTVL